jgi:hypothetical protein
VVGAHIEVMEETLAEVTAYQDRKRWYMRRTLQPEVLRKFLEAKEALVKKGTCFECRSLPHPWEDVVVFVQ